MKMDIRLDRGEIVGKCCICGREGAFLALGMWWCPEHYDMVDSEPVKARNFVSEVKSRSQSSMKLGLKWL